MSDTQGTKFYPIDVTPAQVHPPVVTLKPDNIFVARTARIDSLCKLEGGEGLYIADFVHIASFCHLNIGGGHLLLEEGSSCASGVRIITGSNIPNGIRSCSAIAPDAIIKRSSVRVKRNAVLFAGAIVLPGVTIGEGAQVAAGSVVRCDIPDGELWGGVPAKRLRGRPAFTNTNTPVTEHPMEHSTSALPVRDDSLYLDAMGEFYGWGMPT